MRDFEHLNPPERQDIPSEYMAPPEEIMQCEEYIAPQKEYNDFPEAHWETEVQEKLASETSGESGTKRRDQNSSNNRKKRTDRAEKAKRQQEAQQKSKSFASQAGSQLGSVFPMVGMTAGIAMTVVVSSVASGGTFLPGVAEAAVAIADRLNTPMVSSQEGMAVEEVIAAFSEDADAESEEKETVEKLAEAETGKKDSKKEKKTVKSDQEKEKVDDKKEEKDEKPSNEKEQQSDVAENADNLPENSHSNISGGTQTGGGNGTASNDGDGTASNGGSDTGIGGNHGGGDTNSGTDDTPTTPVVPEVPHSHSYIWETVQAASCTTDGIQRGICSCGETVEKRIPATGHTLEIIEAVAPTCEWTGLTEGEKCSVCGEVLKAQEDISMLPHTKVEIPAVAATCTTAGSTAGEKCSVCDTILVQPTEIAALGHNVPEGTMIDDMNHSGACTRCNETVTEAHVMIDYTCTECGSLTDEKMVFTYSPIGTTGPNWIVGGYLKFKSALDNTNMVLTVEQSGFTSPWTIMKNIQGNPNLGGEMIAAIIMQPGDSACETDDGVLKITIQDKTSQKIIYQEDWKFHMENRTTTLEDPKNQGEWPQGNNTIIKVN